MAIVEAAAAGLLVVSTAVGGVPEVQQCRSCCFCHVHGLTIVSAAIVAIPEV